MARIKNFCIIAHIDHGKSTLSDRLIEAASDITAREMRPQLLDSMDLEREKGITIKLNSVRLLYGGVQLNLIDTPGHADFSYEVSRSLSACEGAILLIDATKGIQAQTISNYFLARKYGLSIIYGINKVDVPHVNLGEIGEQVRGKLGINPDELLHISARDGTGVDILLQRIIDKFPDANNEVNKPLKALIFDSFYHEFKGAIMFIRVFEGSIRRGDRILFMQTGKVCDVIEVGIKTPAMKVIDSLVAGEVGWINASIKNLNEIRVGDTVTLEDEPCEESCAGYEEVFPMVYSSFFPVDSDRQNSFKLAVEKIALSDGSFVYQYESSNALGFGCRCGFLGLLHLEIIKERLLREHGIPVIITSATVQYEAHLTNGEVVSVTSPLDYPDPTRLRLIKEPYVHVRINTPREYVGSMMELLDKHRSNYLDMQYLSEEQVVLEYDLPLSEMMQDFYDAMKTLTKGYASLDYQLLGYRESRLVRVDILLNGVMAPAFSFISHVDGAYQRARRIVIKLKENIDPHLFEISIQAAINSKVISRENVKSIGKNVTAKCYGGDITRKKKLWEQQKRGKKRMRQVGKVNLPKDIFEKIFKT